MYRKSLRIPKKCKPTKEKNWIADQNISKIIANQLQEKYREEKLRDEDTIERKSIYQEIKRLMGYGLCQQEVVQRLTERFPDSNYQGYFKNWVKDQLARKRPMDKPKEEDGLEKE